MALKGKQTFIDNFKTLMNNMKGIDNSDKSIEKFTSDLADLIDELVRSGVVEFSAGTVQGFCPQNANLQNGLATNGEIK